MKCTPYLMALALLGLATQATAATGWLDDDINDILNKVRSMFTTISGDVKDTAADFKRQLTSLQQKGATLKETVDDTFDFIQHRDGPFHNFVNGGSTRCGNGSPCYDFRLDVENFVLDMADLKSKFPQIERHGLGDGTLLVDIIDHMPPLALFGVYEILQRVPNWQDVPQNLSDLYDEIDDPDVFSLELPGASSAVSATVAHVTAKAGGGQANFGSPETKTDIFCSKGKQPKMDAVRLNRLKAFFLALKTMLEGVSEFASDDKTIVAAGEGTNIKMPTGATLKTIASVIEAIFDSVDAHRANLDVCKKVETDIAGCTQLLEYRTAAGNKKAYWVVKGIIHAQGDFSPTADSLLTQAGGLHRNYMWQDAYKKICDAYAAIF